jgi:hypothetical protein
MYTVALTPSRSDFYNPMKHLRGIPAGVTKCYLPSVCPSWSSSW